MKRLARLAAALALLGLGCAPAGAHPLGQNAYNRDAAIRVEPARLRLDYLLDLAEIPTLAAGEEADADHDGLVSDAEWAAYAASWARTLPLGLVVMAGGKPLALRLASQTWALAPGQSGLKTLRLLARLEAPLALGSGTLGLDYRDDTRADRLGWKEVSISAGSGVQIIASTVPQEDRSRSMTDFSPRREGPPALLSAHAEFVATAAAATVDTPASDAPLLEIAAKAGSAQPASSSRELSVFSFFKLGVHHIATGWDHLMFLLGLVLLSRELRQLMVTVTAFTVAHSITLGLAAFGLARPPGDWVEALIAATIAYVGLVALSGRRSSHGPWLAFGFGLIHGFGFAGALSESLGAGNSLRLSGLLSFNLGIEAFQLSLVAAVVPLLRALAGRSGYPLLYSMLAASVVLSGSAWLLFRTAGDGMIAQAGLALVIVALLVFLVRTQRRGQAPVAA